MKKILQNKDIRFWGLQVLLAILLVCTLIYIALISLDSWTRHNEFVVVPDLSSKPLSEVEKILEDNHLRFEVVDSANYNDKIPKYAVISQSPEANEKVKKNRKIYLTLNPSNYPKVTIPRVIQLTYRSADATLKSVGLSVGKVTYVNNIGKDVVLRMFYKGKEVKPGDLLIKKSIVDLECGNGFDPNNPEINFPTSTTEDNSQENQIDF
jgi:pasta domain containing protein|nr:PASTA domain-containing protein [uncultured Capnocytophaga sp.]